MGEGGFMIREIVIVGNARCYHTMDKYRLIRRAVKPRKTVFLTDLINSESHEVLVAPEDVIEHLFNVDWLLFKTQSSLGDVWRNLVKFCALPVQIIRLRRFASGRGDAIFHAITMYYMVLCWAAGISFIGTPQGSEVLQRPLRSRIYRFFARKALGAAESVFVDSVNMKNAVAVLSGKEAVVVKNGFDVGAILATKRNSPERKGVVSIRGMHPLYRIEEILKARNLSSDKPPISFLYPFWDDMYKKKVFPLMREGDADLGRLSKGAMYDLMGSTLLAISIPKSDSSPRTVYEAIFSGCCVAVAYSPWIEELPDCMKKRLFIVDPAENFWLDSAMKHARAVCSDPFSPSNEAILMCDQNSIIRDFCERFYGATKPAANSLG